MSTIGGNLGLSSPAQISDKAFDKLITAFAAYVDEGKEITKALNNPVVKKMAHLYDIPTLVGIEIEVENIEIQLPVPDFWQVDKDNSLRNNGKEIQSRPLTPEQAVKSLLVLWNVMNKWAKPDFSWRTSIHFHLNILELQPEELRKFLLLTLLCENLLFAYAGRDREQSIFCVPLSQSTQMSLIRAFIQKKKSVKEISGQNWLKYSAVGLFRVHDLGTIEFRHLGGTGDLKRVLMWLSFILQLYRAAVAMPMDLLKERILDLNSSSQYYEFLASIFTPEILQEMPVKNFQDLLATTISRAKDFFVDPVKYSGTLDESSLGKFAMKMAHGKKVKAA